MTLRSTSGTVNWLIYNTPSLRRSFQLETPAYHRRSPLTAMAPALSSMIGLLAREAEFPKTTVVFTDNIKIANVVLHCFLTGTLVMRGHTYYQRFPTDKARMKWLVAAILLVSTCVSGLLLSHSLRRREGVTESHPQDPNCYRGVVRAA